MTPHPPARRVLRAGLVWLVISAGTAVRAESEADLDRLSTLPTNCAALAATPWPRSAQAQAALLRLMEVAADACNNDAAFLAALGGAWLEVGDAKQALLRLERALLLDPDLLPAQADHALALAALGEPAAREELVRAWQSRTDVPPVLWKRLNDPAPRLARGTTVTVPGRADADMPAPGWVQLREVQLLTGYENNLVQSPRLSELTITPPDGPVTLPLARPLAPRAGGAALLDMTWQGAISPSNTRSYLVGIQASTRHAPGDSDTDWHSVRLGLGAYQTAGDWRWQLQGRAQYAGGALSEDSRMWRLGLGAEGPAGNCSQRWYVETEDRRYREIPINDTQVEGVSASLLCAVPGLRGWTLGLSVARGQDRARLDQRPGGNQKKSGAGLRLLIGLGRSGRDNNPWFLDAQWRYSHSKDEEGFSPLLENNVRRSTKNQQLVVELTGPWFELAAHRAESVIQVLVSREKSNLAVFSFEAASIYGGLRYKW
ncbi:MAG: hypothetical protein IPF94_08990 [Betaproteobacteria bacterium]|nr:hypothetical protein [Betaproteobacteria bacterium]